MRRRPNGTSKKLRIPTVVEKFDEHRETRHQQKLKTGKLVEEQFYGKWVRQI